MHLSFGQIKPPIDYDPGYTVVEHDSRRGVLHFQAAEDGVPAADFVAWAETEKDEL